jgi:hypothetical protein
LHRDSNNNGAKIGKWGGGQDYQLWGGRRSREAWQDSGLVDGVNVGLDTMDQIDIVLMVAQKSADEDCLLLCPIILDRVAFPILR